MKKIKIVIISMLIVFIISQLITFHYVFGSLNQEVQNIEDEIYDESKLETECLVPDIEFQDTLKNNEFSRNIKGQGINLLGPYNGLTYYSQADRRWANMLYTSTNNTTQTMKSSGCGPTVAAIVVSSSKGRILPPTMADLFVKNGFRTSNNGTAWSAFPFIANYFEFNNYVYTTNINNALDYLKKGYYIIVSCGNGLFTTNGHYIVLIGINDNILAIYDSYMYDGKFDIPSRKGKVRVDGNTIYCSISNFSIYSNYRAFWCYSNDNGANNPNNNINLTYTPGSYIVNTKILRVRSGPGTAFKIITRIHYGSKQGIDYTDGSWGHLLNNAGWICLDYCRKISTSNEPPKLYLSGMYTVTTNFANLRIRIGPSTNYRIVGSLKKGSRVIIDYTDGNWGHLSNNMGWICLDYCTLNKEFSKYSPGSYQVQVSTLRVRRGPGTNYRIVAKIYYGSKQGIDYTNGNWGHLLNNAGWICLDYCKKIN